LLYVALTRTEQAMWLGVANRQKDFKEKSNAPHSALSVLLKRKSGDDLSQQLETWKSCADISVILAPEVNDTLYVPSQPNQADKGTFAKRPSRVLPNAGWTASFSALTRKLHERGIHQTDSGLARDARWQDSQIDNLAPSSLDVSAMGESTEPTTDQPLYNDFPAGSAYGTLLHDIFEWQLKEGWPLLQNPSDVSVETQLRWQRWWQTQADSLQLTPEHQTLCLQLIRQCATNPLNQLGSDQHCFSLSQLNAQNAWPEMGFTFKTHGVSTLQIDALISKHVHAVQARPALQAKQLNGLLTGFMDIVFEHEGRYFVLDYKSNKLPSYTPDTIMHSMLSHRYDVQYTLYVLAVHRLLKSRLENYDYDQHMGGAVYLYLRGIDQVGQGVYFNKPPFELIDALDEAFKAQQDLALAGVVT